MSAATIDRLLRTHRPKSKPSRNTPKPGTRLRQKIPVRTFAEWDGARPGFLEVDLVAHCGESTKGEYLHTLSTVGVATRWELWVLPNRSRKVKEAVDRIRERLPFPLLGIDSDNDSAFINANLLRYCQEEGITFTRCRPYKKNDQAPMWSRRIGRRCVNLWGVSGIPRLRPGHCWKKSTWTGVFS